MCIEEAEVGDGKAMDRVQRRILEPKSKKSKSFYLTKVHTINSTREMGKKATVSAQERRVINYKGRGQII